MKKIMFILINLVIALSMISSFSLIGCKGEAVEEAVEEVEEVEEEVEEAVEEVEEAVVEEPVEIEFFTWQWVEPANQLYLEEFKKAFEEEYPNITLNITGISSGEYNQKLLTRISSGDAPDVFAVRPTQVAQLIDLGALQNLDEWIADAPWKDDLLSAQGPGIKDGSYYAIIYTSTPQELIYNKSILEQAGVDVPTDTDELFDVAQKIYEETGIFGYGCVTDMTNIQHVNIESRKWVCGFGGDWSIDNYPSANNPDTIEGIKYYKELYDAEFSPKGQNMGNIRQMIWEGNVAMTIDGAWLFGMTNSENPDMYENLDAALPPTPTHASIVGGAFYAMGTDSDNNEAAWKVLDLYNQKEWQEKLVSMTAQIPGQEGMITEEVLEENPWWAVFDEGAAKYAAGYGYMAAGFELVADEYNNEIGIALADIMQGGADIEERLNELQDTLVEKFVE